jgi:7-carboxy-7-deazaguanine synthase
MKLSVNEIFYSIQGEASYAGYPCIFIRLAGCNLRCAYCDTRYAYESGRYMSIDAVLEKIGPIDCSLVQITGGEPLVQYATPVLIKALADKKYRLLLETNGSLSIAKIDKRCIKIMDVKCPSSKEEKQNDPENLRFFQPDDQIKFVIGDRNDYDYARTYLGKYGGNLSQDQIFFSCVQGKLSYDELACWILDDHLKARMNLQWHKFIWPYRERGV